MMLDRQLLRKDVLALNLPAIVSRIFDGAEIPEELTYRCGSPFHSLSDDSGLPVAFLPLWECGVVAVGFDRDADYWVYPIFSLHAGANRNCLASLFTFVAYQD